jgi:hypothetical protein
LVGKDFKLKELKEKGLGPANGPVGSWALAWDHYALAGDALTAAEVDANGFVNVKGVKIGPDHTVGDLINALQK